ncbi:hypothetical protein KW801_01975 [Candidatus Saccharibacteria bacterium]|nr:hypothetical protein [Candidatus Saccharibacteria bacterium]
MSDSQVTIDLAHIASEAAEQFESRNEKFVRLLHERAISITGSEHVAGMAFIRAFAQRAAIARLEERHDIVSRLKNGAYKYLSCTADKSIVHNIFAGFGACGHQQPRPKNHKPSSQVFLAKG